MKPKLTVLLLVFFAIIANFTFLSGQETIHERIGQKIEQNERDYFGLFQSIQDFREATLSHVADTNYTIHIKHGLETPLDTSIVLTENELGLLRQYINNYEKYFKYSEKYFSEISQILAHKAVRSIVKPVMLINSFEEIDIELFDETEISSGFLFADSTCLVVWTGGKDYDWKEKDKIKIIPYNEIKDMGIPRRMDMNGNKEIYSAILGDINNDIPFKTSNVDNYSMLPPEVIEALGNKPAASTSKNLPQFSLGEVLDMSRKSLHIEFLARTGMMQSINRIVVRKKGSYYYSGDIKLERRTNIGFGFVTRISYGIFDRLRCGIEIDRYSDNRSSKEGIYDDVFSIGPTFKILPFDISLINNLDVVVNAGFFYTIFNSTIVSSDLINQDLLSDVTSGFNYDTYAAVVGLGLEYYFSGAISAAGYINTIFYGESFKNLNNILVGSRYGRRYYYSILNGMSKVSFRVGAGLSYHI